MTNRMLIEIAGVEAIAGVQCVTCGRVNGRSTIAVSGWLDGNITTYCGFRGRLCPTGNEPPACPDCYAEYVLQDYAVGGYNWAIVRLALESDGHYWIQVNLEDGSPDSYGIGGGGWTKRIVYRRDMGTTKPSCLAFNRLEIPFARTEGTNPACTGGSAFITTVASYTSGSGTDCNGNIGGMLCEHTATNLGFSPALRFHGVANGNCSHCLDFNDVDIFVPALHCGTVGYSRFGQNTYFPGCYNWATSPTIACAGYAYQPGVFINYGYSPSFGIYKTGNDFWAKAELGSGSAYASGDPYPRRMYWHAYVSTGVHIDLSALNGLVLPFGGYLDGYTGLEACAGEGSTCTVYVP